MGQTKDIPNAHGYINLVNAESGMLSIAGWMFDPRVAMDSFKIIIDGKVDYEGRYSESLDIEKLYPFVDHAGRSVFHAIVPYSQESGVSNIEIVGCSGGRETAKLETCFSVGLRPNCVFPDILKIRVANNADNAYFSASSFTSFRNYYEQVRRFSKPGAISTMLDWGCGCGRLTVMFSVGTEIPNIYGCDIDNESITWCRDNLRGCFDVVPLTPPTQYNDAFFDLVVSNSVFTHLTRDIQREWLNEIRRVMAPGGLFIASVHGEFATFFNFGGDVNDALKSGINDGIPDHNLVGVIPDGYYRGTYQKRSYTERVFGEYFEILDYIEAGSLNFQDLVVMRRPVG